MSALPPSRPRPRRPRPRGRSALGVLLAAAAGCAPVEAPPPGAVDLLAAAHAPLTAGETGVIRPGAAPLGEGFHPSAATGEGEGWAGPGPATVWLQFASSRRRWIELDTLPLSWPGAPPQEVEVRLDGEPIGTFTSARGGSTTTLAVPPRLSVPGRHALELRFSRATAPRDVIPGSTDGRRLSLRLRGLRVLPVEPAPEPEWAPGRLELTCGGRASWLRWIVPGSRLDAEIEADQGPGGGEAARAALTAETDGAPPRPLEPGALPPAVAGPARLVLACPPGASGRLTVRRLALEEPAAERPPAAGRPPGRAALVVGRLPQAHWTATPCSTRAGAALRCLLSGVESAAFGYPAEPAVGFVGADAGEVAAWLAAAEPPAVAALVAPGRPAAELAGELRARLPGVAVLLTELPDGPGDLAVGVAVPGSDRGPAGAHHLDLLPTVYGLAGLAAPATRFDGVDLAPALAAERAVGVPPVRFAWDPDRPVAVVEGAVVRPPPAGGAGAAGPERSIRAQVVARRMAERRRELEWLGRLPGGVAPVEPETTAGAGTPR